MGVAQAQSSDNMKKLSPGRLFLEVAFVIQRT